MLFCITLASLLIGHTVGDFNSAVSSINVNRTGCGVDKMCVFKPAGCDPNLDCTVAVVLHVIGSNQMKVQMVAQRIVPPVDQQYISFAFSKDQLMGDDLVTECVLADTGIDNSLEVHLSYNDGKSNDRIALNEGDCDVMFNEHKYGFENSLIFCEFDEQIVPQLANRQVAEWNLNQDFYIFAATGPALANQIGPHEMNRESHFFPVMSAEKFNPTTFGNKFEHPSFNAPKTETNRVPTIPVKASNEDDEPAHATKSSSTLLISSIFLVIPFIHLL